MSKFLPLGRVFQDIRFALRTMVIHAEFSAVVVLTLAMGIGVNTAIFSLVNGVLLRPLSFDRPNELVKALNRSLPKGGYVALRERLQRLDVACYAHESGFNLTNNGETVRVVADGISSNLFSVLGVKPILGRDFTREDELPGRREVIIGYNLWQSQFGGDRGIIGRNVMLDDVGHEVVGVMPQGFNFPGSSQIWGAFDVNPSADDFWGWGYNVIGRMRPGADLAAVRAEFKGVFPQVVSTFPFAVDPHLVPEADVSLLQQYQVAGVQKMLLMLLAAVTVILLVACVNVANLLLTRSTARQKEMAVRSALGGSRGRIMSQLLTESVILGLAGGALGLALGWISLGFLKSMMPADTPRLAEVAIDRHVLAFSTILSFVVGLIFGTLPAVHASRPDIEQVLRANASTSGASRRRNQTSAILVIAEIAMAVVLVSDAGLFIKSLWRLSNMNTGVLQEERLLIGNVTPSWAFYKSGDQCAGFYRDVLESVNHLPGVKSAALADTLPLENAFGGLIAAKDQPESVTSPYATWTFTVSPGYLKTMGIPLLRGRDFTMADRKGSPAVVLVSRNLAGAMWPGQNPIGQLVSFATLKEKREWSTVVGLVEDVQHYSSVPGFNSGARGDLYFASTQGTSMLPYFLNIVVRSEGDLPDMQKQVAGAIAHINSSVPMSKWRTMRQIVSRSTATNRSTTRLFVLFAGLALFLGVVGIYSVISYTVIQRTREIGIRMALGADRPQILRMIVRHGAILALIGLALGTAGAIALNQVISSQLYDVKPNDPLTYVIVAALVAIAAILATLVPSFRATKVNPTVALHCE